MRFFEGYRSERFGNLFRRWWFDLVANPDEERSFCEFLKVSDHIKLFIGNPSPNIPEAPDWMTEVFVSVTAAKYCLDSESPARVTVSVPISPSA